MFENIFYSDTYLSPEPEPGFKTWLLRDNWLYFVINYLGIVIRTRRKALKGIYDYKEWADSSIEILRLIEKVGGRFMISGMDNISKAAGPVVFISNHMSTLETMIFPGIIAPRLKVTFVVKESLVKHPLFGPVMRSRNPVIVSRKDTRKDFETVMNCGTKLLSEGISIIIFPQGRRSKTFKPEEFNTLGVKLAKKANVPVVPTAIKTDFWGNGKIIKELGKLDHRKIIYIKFGTPFSVKGTGREENQYIIKFIQENLTEWDNYGKIKS